MKTTATILILLSIAFTVHAQVPVKKDLMRLINKQTPPPSSSKDAFARISSNDNSGAIKCSAEKLFEPIEQEVKNVEAEYESQAKSATGSMPPGLSSGDMKKMNDPEMKKKMKSMSKEEKMKMAMEMMKSMPAGGPATEMDPPPVRAALDEWQIIYNDTQNEFQRSVAEQTEETQLLEEYQKAQAEVDAWEKTEISKLPHISSGEMSAPDPAKVKEVQLKSADKHIAVANKRLEQIRLRWHASVDRTKKRYTVFYQKLIAANYAADSKNFSSKKILSDAQMIILKNIRHQIEQSRNAWEESASWQARRINIEKQ